MLCIVFLTNQAKATHIVGGEIYYDQITPTYYKITMYLYVDCQYGNPGAIILDTIARIGVFNARTNTKLKTYRVKRSFPERIDTINYKCVQKPEGVCVDKYEYITYQTIDPGQDGIILAYQRCCRNNSISNLYFPGETGATYWVKIPPKATKNSSARFKYLPPNYLCVNAPFTADHSATDPDGDDLVYSLVQPYHGASYSDPLPEPSSPPYNRVTWGAGYSTGNQMAGNPILTINNATGLLTVTPNKTGQFCNWNKGTGIQKRCFGWRNYP